MSAKIVFPSALVLTALSLCAARGQTPPGAPGGGLTYPQAAPAPGIAPRIWEGGAAPGAAPDGAAPSAAPAPLAPAGLSSWITYDRPKACCGPIGANGPITTEIFLRAGASIVLNDSTLGRTVQNGWAVDGGARSLFFNSEQTAAWAVTYGVSNYNYHGTRPDIKIPLHLLVPNPTANATPAALPINFGTDVPGVTMRALNETFFNLGFGRDWWFWGSANCCDGPLWRVGFDVGGRYGSGSVRLWELRHRTDVMGGVWVGVHSLCEVPCGCGWFVAGFRAEWGYVWSDIMQRQNDSDLILINLLGQIGYRF
jgi:hypothetical protein